MQNRIFDRLQNCARLKETLVAMLCNRRFSHAVMLEGDAEACRLPALAIAQALVCTAQPDGCGDCPACGKAARGTHPDIQFLGGEGGARSFHIDVVRTLRQEAYIKPNEAACKVYVLLGAQNMTVQAQNALLKILEEPPGQLYFILTCQNRSALLPTLLSRLQVFMPDGEGAAGTDAPGEPDGTDAQPAARQRADEIIRLLGSPGRREYNLLAALAEYERDREGLLLLLHELHAGLARELIGGGGDGPYTGFSPLQLVKILDIINNAGEHIKQNGSIPLAASLLAGRVAAVLNR